MDQLILMFYSLPYKNPKSSLLTVMMRVQSMHFFHLKTKPLGLTTTNECTPRQYFMSCKFACALIKSLQKNNNYFRTSLTIDTPETELC